MEGNNEISAVAGVQNPYSVVCSLDVHVWPDLSVDFDDLPKKLWNPDWELLTEPGRRVIERTILVECYISDRKHNVVFVVEYLA